MKINLGIWNNIFSVPTIIVDKYLTTCDANQLKVLIYLLRSPGKDISTEDISEKLGLNQSDVHSALRYWIVEGIISDTDEVNKIEIENDLCIQAFKHIESSNSQLNSQSTALKNLQIINNIETSIEAQNNRTKNKFKKPSSVAPRLSLKESLDAIEKNNSLKFLIEEVPKILKRTISSTDIIVIISLMAWTEMDVDLALMLMNYCASTDRTSAKEIEKEAYRWTNQGIDSHEKAEEFIKSNLKLLKLQQDVMFAFHKDFLSEREKSFIERWANDLNYDIKMIALAYSRAVTRKGENDFSYINGILTSWFKKGITKPEEADDENNIKKAINKNNNSNKKPSSINGFFNIESSTSFSLNDLKSKMEV